MKKSIITMLMGAALLFSFTNKAEAQNEAELKQKIEKINGELNKATMEGKFSSFINKYYATDVISMPNNMEMVRGIEALRKTEEASENSGKRINYIETNIVQIKECGNLIIEIGTYKTRINRKNEPNEVVTEGKYMNVWEKHVDGSLKIKVETWNSDAKLKE